MRRTPTLVRRALAVMTLFGLVAAVAACGGDDDDAAEPTTAASAVDSSIAEPASTDAAETTVGSSGEAAPPTGEPIKVGFAVGMTGFNSEAQRAVADVAEAWAAYVNDNGGVDGRPVEMTVKDSQGVATTAQAAVKDLVESEGVSVVGLFDAAGAGGVGDYPVQNNVAVVGIGTFNGGQWYALPNYFSSTTSPGFATRTYTVAADQLGATNIGIVVCAEVAVCLDAGTLVEKEAELRGLDFAGTQKAAAADPNYTAQCISLIQNGADFIALGLSTDVWKRAGPDCLQQGFDGTFGLVSGSFIQAAMDEIEGATYAGGLNAFPWWVDEPPVAEYREAMETYAPDADYRNTWATGAWASLKMLQKALESHEGEELTKEDVLAALYSLTDENLDGLLPAKVSFTPGQPSPVMPCSWLAQYTAGEEKPEALESELTELGNGVSGPLATSCLEPLPS